MNIYYFFYKTYHILEEKIKKQTGWNRARIFIIVVSIIKLERVNLKKIAKVLNPNQTKANKGTQDIEIELE
jgi:hypothetical protein